MSSSKFEISVPAADLRTYGNCYSIPCSNWKEKTVSLKQNYSLSGKLFLSKDKCKQVCQSREKKCYICLSVLLWGALINKQTASLIFVIWDWIAGRMHACRKQELVVYSPGPMYWQVVASWSCVETCMAEQTCFFHFKVISRQAYLVLHWHWLGLGYQMMKNLHQTWSGPKWMKVNANAHKPCPCTHKLTQWTPK